MEEDKEHKKHSHVFEINRLTCEYLPEKPVLEIKELKIPSRKLIFVVGRSGIGKSTFIETIGLMNKTMAKNAQTSIKFLDSDGEVTELKDCWNWRNKDLSAFRKSNFSFIFQQTNLMPNFTAGENMAVSLLIQGEPTSVAKPKVLEIMGELGLPEDVYDKKVTELSGGQRQRLAFVRAITADFTVLFGDEPTGNLDTKTSNDLMEILQKTIREKGNTAILVSHDLVLAEDFADMIIPIVSQTQPDGQVYGSVVQEKILAKTETGWETYGGKSISSVSSYLNEHYT